MTKKIVTVVIEGDIHLRAARIALERGLPWRIVITEALEAWIAANAALLRQVESPDASDGRP